ncbi:MAG: hypothetical protein ACI9JN_000324 [Bacteroidia bacterium]|jgi:hypothetical protein
MKRNLLILFIAVGLMSFQTVFPSDYDTDASNIKLGQNYPNPAIGKTYIEANFTGEATLTVYNVVGKVIEERVVTTSLIVLNVTNYTEGIYLYTLESNGEKLTKRMTVKKH